MDEDAKEAIDTALDEEMWRYMAKKFIQILTVLKDEGLSDEHIDALLKARVTPF